MPNKGKTYTGELAKPIRLELFPIKPRGLFDNPESQAQYEKELNQYRKKSLLEIANQTNSKMAMLFEHHQINPNHHDAWKDLSYSLARQHVAGFTLSAKGSGSGRRKEFDIIEQATLYFEFEKIRNEIDIKNQGKTLYTKIRITDALLAEKYSGSKKGNKTLINKYTKSKNNPLIKGISELNDAPLKECLATALLSMEKESPENK